MEWFLVVLIIILILLGSILPIGLSIWIIKLKYDYLAKKIAKEIALNNEDLAKRIAYELQNPTYTTTEWQ